MAKQYFLPRKDSEKAQWLRNFAGKLGNYANKYGISQGEVIDMQTSSVAFDYWLDFKSQFDEYVKKLTQYKNELRDGIPTGAAASIIPSYPALQAPTQVEPGIFVRATALANIIKNRVIYTEADGLDLGIEGTANRPDVNSMKPTISVRLVAGGHPEIVWTKNGMDGIDIYKDSGNGWQMYAFDGHPNYLDKAPLPAVGQSAVWHYKCIYRLDDEPAGQWSDTVTITVTGVV
jgi:hypothetical protein